MLDASNSTEPDIVLAAQVLDTLNMAAISSSRLADADLQSQA
jgi:hypothetical protein